MSASSGTDHTQPSKSENAEHTLAGWLRQIGRWMSAEIERAIRERGNSARSAADVSKWHLPRNYAAARRNRFI